MFARGVFSFHSAPLPTCPEKSLSPIIPALARRARKSNHSRTYGIAGGGGCTGLFVRPIHRASKPFVSPTYQVSARNSLVSPTYAKTGGGGIYSQNSFLPSRLLQLFTKKCRRADIFDFSHFFRNEEWRPRRRRPGLRRGLGRGRGGVRGRGRTRRGASGRSR